MMELEGPFSCTFSEHLLFIRSMKMNEALSVREVWSSGMERNP